MPVDSFIDQNLLPDRNSKGKKAYVSVFSDPQLINKTQGNSPMNNLKTRTLLFTLDNFSFFIWWATKSFVVISDNRGVAEFSIEMVFIQSGWAT